LFWASPENYEHVAGKKQRIISIGFTGDEIEDYQKLIEISGVAEAQLVIKELIRDYLR